MTFSVEDRQRVCLKRWARVKWQDIVESLDGKISLSSCQRIWNDFLETGSAEPLEDDRARRKDCQLTEAEQDWLARRIFDAPDLYIRELREIFVHFERGTGGVAFVCLASSRSLLALMAVCCQHRGHCSSLRRGVVHLRASQYQRRRGGSTSIRRCSILRTPRAAQHVCFASQ